MAARGGNGGKQGGGNGQGGGGKGGGKGGAGGGKGGAGDANTKRLQEQLRQKDAEIRKLKADKGGQADAEEEPPDDEEMDDELKSKEDFERAIEISEADREYAKSMHEKYPKVQKIVLQIEEANAAIEAAREKIGELRSPSDQIRYTAGKKQKVAARLKKLEEDIVAEAIHIAERQDKLDEMREQFHEGQDELQALESKMLLLVAPTGVSPPPVDVAVCVEAMAGDLGHMFNDPRLSAEAKAKRAEVEAGFVEFRRIFGILSSVKLEYDAACSSAPQAPRPEAVPDARPAPNATEGEQAGVEQAGGPPTQVIETTEVGAAMEQTPVPGNAPAVVAPIPDGPSEERSANRDRTPPPGNRASAAKKTSFDEVLGPRKSKGGEAKAAAKPTGKAAARIAA